MTNVVCCYGGLVNWFGELLVKHINLAGHSFERFQG